MTYFADGVKVGLILSLMTGPLFLSLVQTGLERGFRAGTMVGAGIWSSDILFITGVYFGLSYVSSFVSGQLFTLVLGIIGGVLLVTFGIGSLLIRRDISLGNPVAISGAGNWLSLWLKGFLINTINPFTFFFWIGIAGVVVVDGELQQHEAFSYFAGIMTTIVSTDILKVALAKRIRRLLQPKHLMWMRRIAGLGLILFGIALLVRVLIQTPQ
jgi:threonine/homoserine/homoserine lactone efflux protein